MKKKIIWIIVLIFFLIIIFFSFFKNLKRDETIKTTTQTEENLTYNSNILKDVNYSSKDARGNEYIIKASSGEIDFSNNNIIFLTEVNALIKLNNSNNVEIYSNYGKYNTLNHDTIFTKNVKVNYLENEITGEYLDFSIQRNSMIISKDVVYKNLKNILKADVIEVNIKTKDTKIFMYEKNKKVNVKNLN